MSVNECRDLGKSTGPQIARMMLEIDGRTARIEYFD